VTLLAWAATNATERLFDSAGVRQGMPWIVGTICLFSCNKVLMNALNGVREMRAFALAQGGRFVMMFGLLAWFAAARAPGERLVAVIFGAELLLLGYLAYRCARRFPVNLDGLGLWLRRHLTFGTKGFLSGSMSELNSRVDVVILGILASDTAVGIYSFAATVAEGLSQLPIVLRNNLNPLLTQAFVRADLPGLSVLAARARRGTYLAMALVLAAAVIVFPIFVELAVGAESFGEAVLIFVILCAGLWVGCGYMPLDMVLAQCGFPGWQSGFKAAVLLTNIAFNLALIPMLGSYGAAIAMAATWAFSALYVRQLGRRAIGVAI
jgi:O-antigen/teichoic acid export membrane protein